MPADVKGYLATRNMGDNPTLQAGLLGVENKGGKNKRKHQELMYGTLCTMRSGISFFFTSLSIREKCAAL